MRALAHPLKWELLEYLLVAESATSTQCAEHLGQSQASCSFHLRQLARYGLVEEAPSTSRRERPWRLTSFEQSWSPVQPDEERAGAAAELERVFLEREIAKLVRWARTASSYSMEWRRAALRAGAQSWLTAYELAALNEQMVRLMMSFQDRLADPDQRPPGARPVRLFAVDYPLPET